MSCQHPNCSKTIHSICTTHCQWSLCIDHIKQHRSSLINQFELILNELIQLANGFGCEIDREHLEQEMKQIEIYETQIKVFEDDFQKISKDFLQLENNKNLLRTNHFQTIENLREKIEQTTISPYPPPLLPTIQKLSPNQCPLKIYNTFGLLPSHQIRLCSSNRDIQNLIQHFRTYHHLSDFYSKQLLDAIKSNLDPKQIIIFPPNESINDTNDRFLCPLHDSNQCSLRVTQRYLPIHLKIAHRLRSNQIKNILQTN